MTRRSRSWKCGAWSRCGTSVQAGRCSGDRNKLSEGAKLMNASYPQLGQPLTLSGTWRRAAARSALALVAITQEMTFIEHLEELRKRILWSVVSVAAAFAVCWVFAGNLYDLA